MLTSRHIPVVHRVFITPLLAPACARLWHHRLSGSATAQAACYRPAAVQPCHSPDVAVAQAVLPPPRLPATGKVTVPIGCQGD